MSDRSQLRVSRIRGHSNIDQNLVFPNRAMLVAVHVYVPDERVSITRADTVQHSEPAKLVEDSIAPVHGVTGRREMSPVANRSSDRSVIRDDACGRATSSCVG